MEFATVRTGVRLVANQVLPSNTYVLASRTPGKCMVVDPGLDPPILNDALGAAGWVPEAVLCTHGHFDHIGGAAELQTRYEIPVYLCAADAKTAKMSNFLMAAFKMDIRIKLPEFEFLQGEDPVLECGGRSVRFHSVPGHTPGGAAIEVDGLLFSGDSLYATRVALSRMRGEDSPTLRASLRRLFARVSDDLLVLPGHGKSALLKDILGQNRLLNEFMAQSDGPPHD